MKKTTLLLVGILIFSNCKEKVAEFLFDNTKVSELTKYSYEYNSEKLISQTERSYIFMQGFLVDSFIVETKFEYNEKGFLTKEIINNNYKEKPDIELYTYNIEDSLIRKIRISSSGDTSSWFEYEYFPDGQKLVFDRALFLRIDPNQSFMEVSEIQLYDTISSRSEYEYFDNKCISRKRYNNHTLISSVEYEYENELLKNEKHYSYYNSMKLFDKTVHYDYSESKSQPNSFALDSKKDTVEYQFNRFENHKLISATELYEYGNWITKHFYENGKELGMVVIDKNNNYRSVESYIYYDNGDLKEIKRYNEELNAR